MFRCRRAEHRLVAVAEITSLAAHDPHAGLVWASFTVSLLDSFLYRCICVFLCLFFGLSRSRSLFLLFSLVLCRSRIACVLDVCALALSALVLHLSTFF